MLTDINGMLHFRCAYASTVITGRTPLHIAAFIGHLKIVKLLISYHADIDAV